MLDHPARSRRRFACSTNSASLVNPKREPVGILRKAEGASTDETRFASFYQRCSEEHRETRGGQLCLEVFRLVQEPPHRPDADRCHLWAPV